MSEEQVQGGDAAARALQELALTDLSGQTTQSFLRRVCELAKTVVGGAEEVSVTLLSGGAPSTPASTGSLSTRLDEVQYALGEGPCLTTAEHGSVHRIDDARAEERWPQFVAAAVPAGLGSSLSVPVPVRGEVEGALNMYSRTPEAFAAGDDGTASRFASYAGVAFGNLLALQTSQQLAEQLREAMDSRAAIDQAKGVLMAARGCSAAEAFDVLVQLSQQTNTKLRVVAERLLDEATRREDQGR